MNNDRGFISFIIGALIFLGLIAAVLIAFSLGLDNLYKEQTNESLFPKDAKIHEIRALVRKKKSDLSSDTSGNTDSSESASQVARAPEDKPVTADDRLDQIHQRLKSSSAAAGTDRTD